MIEKFEISEYPVIRRLFASASYEKKTIPNILNSEAHLEWKHLHKTRAKTKLQATEKSAKGFCSCKRRLSLLVHTSKSVLSAFGKLFTHSANTDEYIQSFIRKQTVMSFSILTSNHPLYKVESCTLNWKTTIRRTPQRITALFWTTKDVCAT